MSSSSSLLASLLQFPFPSTFLAKDVIPELPPVSPNSVIGCPNGFAGGGLDPQEDPLVNCCFIEVALHVLLNDPFLQFFILNCGQAEMANCMTPQQAKPHLLELRKERLPSLYEFGWDLMTLLYDRWINSNFHSLTRRESFLRRSQRAYTKLRTTFGVLDPWSKHGRQEKGDARELLRLCTEALALFIAINWNGHVFQLHWRAYGFMPLLQSKILCVGDPRTDGACAREGREASVMILPDLEQQMNSSRISILPKMNENNDLGSLINAALNSSWSRRDGAVCPSCDSASLISCNRLVTFPWTLHVSIERPELNFADRPFQGGTDMSAKLQYNVDSLQIGPSTSGLLAIYQLQSRINYRRAHFTADVRVEGKQSSNFVLHNFDHQTERKLSQEAESLSVFMSWRRIQ